VFFGRVNLSAKKHETVLKGNHPTSAIAVEKMGSDPFFYAASIESSGTAITAPAPFTTVSHSPGACTSTWSA